MPHGLGIRWWQLTKAPKFLTECFVWFIIEAINPLIMEWCLISLELGDASLPRLPRHCSNVIPSSLLRQLACLFWGGASSAWNWAMLAYQGSQGIAWTLCLVYYWGNQLVNIWLAPYRFGTGRCQLTKAPKALFKLYAWFITEAINLLTFRWGLIGLELSNASLSRLSRHCSSTLSHSLLRWLAC